MPEPRRPRDNEELAALREQAVRRLRIAVLEDGGAFGVRASIAIEQFIGRAYELGAAHRSYWEARAAQEHELLKQSERRRRETEQELESYRPTPPSTPAARRRSWRPATTPPIPREEEGGRSRRDDEITQRIDLELDLNNDDEEP
jgi:hypothetical protein